MIEVYILHICIWRPQLLKYVQEGVWDISESGATRHRRRSFSRMLDKVEARHGGSFIEVYLAPRVAAICDQDEVKRMGNRPISIFLLSVNLRGELLRRRALSSGMDAKDYDYGALFMGHFVGRRWPAAAR